MLPVCSSGHPRRLAVVSRPALCFPGWECHWPARAGCLPPANSAPGWWGGCWPGRFIQTWCRGLPLGSSGLDSWEGMSWWADLFKSTCRALTRFAILDQQYIVERKMQRRAGQVWGSQGTLPDLVPIASRPQWWKCPLIVYSPAFDWVTYVSLNTGCSSWFKWHGNTLGQSEFIVVVYSWICSL